MRVEDRTGGGWLRWTDLDYQPAGWGVTCAPVTTPGWLASDSAPVDWQSFNCAAQRESSWSRLWFQLATILHPIKIPLSELPTCFTFEGWFANIYMLLNMENVLCKGDFFWAKVWSDLLGRVQLAPLGDLAQPLLGMRMLVLPSFHLCIGQEALPNSRVLVQPVGGFNSPC